VARHVEDHLLGAVDELVDRPAADAALEDALRGEISCSARSRTIAAW
jgi:hypothetical protein